MNVKAGQDVELLHTKIDALYGQLATEQQQKVSLEAEQKIELLHAQMDMRGQLTAEQQQQLKEIQTSVVPSLNVQQNHKFPKESSAPKSFDISKSMEDNTEFIDHLFR